MKKDTAPFVWGAVSFLVWGIFILLFADSNTSTSKFSGIKEVRCKMNGP
ncbi:hypothetical protein EMIT019CA3_170073 [Bacillus pseudomycoides]